MKKESDPINEMRAEYDFSGGVRGKYASHFATPSETAYTLPVDWITKAALVSSISRDLCADALLVSSNIGNILSTNVTSIPANQFSSLASQISSTALGINRLVASADVLGNYSTIASSLIGNASLAAYTQIPSAIAVTSSYLDSASALTNALRVDTQFLAQANLGTYLTSHGAQLNAFDPLSAAGVSDVSTLSGVAARLGSGLASASYLLDTTLATSRLTSEAFSFATNRGFTDYLSASTIGVSELSSIGAVVYSDIALSNALSPTSFLFAAPIIEPYAHIQATAVIIGVDDDEREAQREEQADSVLDALGDELETRLSQVDPSLADVYREGITAIRSGNKGWIRHAGVSLRTMFDHLLRHLAPSTQLDRFLDDPNSHKKDGEYLRSARLKYVFRDVAVGSYARMAEHDMKLAEATFFPTNDIVHQLRTSLTERQMQVLFRRIQGSVSVVLAASGY